MLSRRNQRGETGNRTDVSMAVRTSGVCSGKGGLRSVHSCIQDGNDEHIDGKRSMCRHVVETRGAWISS